MDIQSSTAIVSGGASGLGEANVRMLVAQGGRVVIADINVERGESLASELGESVRFVRTDVSDEASVRNAVTVAQETYGNVRVAICCAGIGTVGKMLSRRGPLDFGLYRKTLEVNLMGSFLVCRCAAEAISESEPGVDGERGVLIMTASVAAFDGQIGQVSYSASKGGIVGMTLPMARDLASYGIRVMTIAPGLFDTPLLAGLPEPARQSLAQQVPFPVRLGQPAEMASLAQQIIENPMLNGEVIRLDGAIRMSPR
jgi:NAD(P)-dependent dehydrogenase (short-subunit alcohol dehydrogenase family)